VLACGIVVFGLIILVSALIKLIAGFVWPTYVAAGRIVGLGQRRESIGCTTSFIQGCKAGYQIIWFGDLLTNACIIGRFDLLKPTLIEFIEIARGERIHFSSTCCKIAWLPHVTIGVFEGSWDVAETLMAQEMGVRKETVAEAWQSMEKQMIQVAKSSLKAGLLTEDYIREVPPSLVIGLPARVALDTIERSPANGVKLGTGLLISDTRRPRGAFADKVWTGFREAKTAWTEMGDKTSDANDLLCCMLLAGGGDPSDLPPSLQASVHNFEKLPPEVRVRCSAVYQPLIAIAIDCSRQQEFRQRICRVFDSVLKPCISCGGHGCSICEDAEAHDV
jgi:hypothetical protein